MYPNNEVGNAFADALKKMLESTAGLTIADAAKELGVSRQSFHSYLLGKLPRRKRLNKAVHLWDLKLDLGRYSFDKGAFPTEEKKIIRHARDERQPTLWEALDAVREEDLHVEMKRVGKVLRFEVRIEIPA